MVISRDVTLVKSTGHVWLKITTCAYEHLATIIQPDVVRGDGRSMGSERLETAFKSRPAAAAPFSSGRRIYSDKPPRRCLRIEAQTNQQRRRRFKVRTVCEREPQEKVKMLNRSQSSASLYHSFDRVSSCPRVLLPQWFWVLFPGAFVCFRRKVFVRESYKSFNFENEVQANHPDVRAFWFRL